MTTYKFTNFAQGQLNAAIGAEDVTLALKTGEGAEFPSITTGERFMIYVYQTGKSEWMTVTGRSSDTLTVTRGDDPQSFDEDAYVELRLDADVLELFMQKNDFRTVEEDPDGSLAASYTGEEVYNSETGVWWKHCTGTTWKAMNL